jgi:hypothetical protein
MIVRLEAALALADELDDSTTGYLIGRWMKRGRNNSGPLGRSRAFDEIFRYDFKYLEDGRASAACRSPAVTKSERM